MLINAVTGKIAPQDLGRTLIHEHVVCSAAEFKIGFGEEWHPREKIVPRAVERLRYARERHQVKTIVDATPPALGRDLGLLREVAERSGVQIIASTGFYHYPSLPVDILEPESLAECFIREIENGSIGFLKGAVDAGGVQTCHKRMLQCLAIVQQHTHLPLYIHSFAGDRNGFAVLDVLEECNVPLHRVVLGHAADTCDFDYLQSLLRRGCNLSIDRIYSKCAADKAKIIARLIKAGFLPQLFVSHDVICCDDALLHNSGRKTEIDWGKVHSCPNAFGVIFEEVLPILHANGITDGQTATLLQKNPQRLWE